MWVDGGRSVFGGGDQKRGGKRKAIANGSESTLTNNHTVQENHSLSPGKVGRGEGLSGEGLKNRKRLKKRGNSWIQLQSLTI